MSLLPPKKGVLMLVVDIARLLRRQFEAALADADTGLTVGEARTLFYIWHNPGLRQAALADKMHVEPMTLVRYLDSLEKAGVIKRHPDPNDGRANLVDLTAEAEPILMNMDTVLKKVRAQALQHIPPEREELLEDLLRSLSAGLQSTPSKDCPNDR